MNDEFLKGKFLVAMTFDQILYFLRHFDCFIDQIFIKKEGN